MLNGIKAVKTSGEAPTEIILKTMKIKGLRNFLGLTNLKKFVEM